MKKLFAAAAVAATVMGAASAADATVYNINLTPLGDGTWTATVGAVVNNGGGAFSDTFNFLIPITGTASSTLATILLNGANNINFSSVVLNSAGGGIANFDITNGGVSQATLTLAPVLAGMASIVVNGDVVVGSAGGSYGGGVNIAPIPEPATWAMMILGMGMVGFGLRMRRRNASALA